MDLVHGSWLKGGEVSLEDVKRYLRDPNVRSDLRKRLELSPNDPRLDDYIAKMMKMIPNRFRTGFVEKEEIQSSEFQTKKYWDRKHDVEQKSQGGFTQEEQKEIRRHDQLVKYIEEKFGK